MSEYLISRKGSNAANQSMQETRPLLLIDADSAKEAREEFESIWMSDFTFYANQTVLVDDAEEITGDDYETLQEIDNNNRQHIREGFVL